MTTPQFEKVNLAWRLQQLQQNLGEWWELQWRRWFGSLPDVQAPASKILNFGLDWWPIV